MKKYIKPELDIIDLSSKELLCDDFDLLPGLGFDKDDTSIPDEWL